MDAEPEARRFKSILHVVNDESWGCAAAFASDAGVVSGSVPEPEDCTSEVGGTAEYAGRLELLSLRVSRSSIS